MNKVSGTIIVCIVGIALGFLVWKLAKVEAGSERSELQFHRSTSWDYDAVRECVKSGNGSHIFRKYERVFILARGGPPEPLDASTYIDASGSTLIIERAKGRTQVRLKSGRPLTEEQKDLLEWCILNPQLTWIPPKFRSKR